MANAFDSTNYLEREPDRVVCGDLWAWKRTDLGADYPPASYAMTYGLALEGVDDTEKTLTASEDGQDYVIEVASATTKDYPPGVYHWQAYITRSSDSERITVGRGRFEALPDLSVAGTDPRSHYKIVLDALEAVLEDKATRDQQARSVAGRSVTLLTPEELRQWIGHYRQLHAQEVAREQVARGRGTGRRVVSRLD